MQIALLRLSFADPDLMQTREIFGKTERWRYCGTATVSFPDIKLHKTAVFELPSAV